MRFAAKIFLLWFAFEALKVDAFTPQASFLSQINDLEESLTRIENPYLLACPSINPIDDDEDSSEWREIGFKNVRVSYLPEFSRSTASNATHTFDLEIVLFENSGWKLRDIRRNLANAQKVLAACRVDIRKVKLIRGEAPPSWLTPKPEVESRASNSMREIADQSPKTKNIRFFYFDHFENYRDAGPKSTAYAGIRSQHGKRGALNNTIWMPLFTNSHTEPVDRLYTTEAHELGHVLMDAPHHVEEQNLMAGERRKLNSRLTKDQCKKMRGFYRMKEF